MIDQQTTQVQIKVGQILYALRHDREFFIQFFLADELTHPVPQFHIDLFELMVSTAVQRCVFAIPRDHAKTTLAKLACVYYFLFTDYKFIIYLSNVSTSAIACCNDVVQFFESENFRNVFGEVKFDVRQEGMGFYRFTLNCRRTNGQIFQKRCVLKALGAGQSVRGINVGHQRPQLAIVDDLEDVENIATEELFIKLKRWFYGTFRKCLDKFDHKIIHIGNMISNKCMLREHCESDYWFSRLYGCILKDGTPLWPEAFPVVKLKADFQEYLKAGLIDVWFTEMMNMPIGVGRGLIKPSEINYQPKVYPEQIEYGFITVDLASTEKTWGHKTAVVVHGWTGTHWQICEIDGGMGIDPIDLFKIIIRLATTWNVTIVGIESVAYQGTLKFVFEYMCIENSIEGMQFVDLYATMRKAQRLSAWAAMIKEKQYAVEEGDYLLTTQLLEYDPKKRDNDDDYIDACAYGVQMIDYYITDIQEKKPTFQIPTGQSSYQLERLSCR